MNRAFLSLYIVIVVTVVGIGWSLDKLWQMYAPQAVIAATEQDLLLTIEKYLQRTPPPQLESAVRELRATLRADIQLFHLDDLAHSAMAQRIIKGRTITVTDATGDRLFYRRLNASPWVINVRQRSTDVQEPIIYDALILAFYACIALAVYFWIWPLSRDLRKLERQTRLVGKDNLPHELDIHRSSAVYEVAVSFNRMAQRIRDLLASHKEMTYAVSHELRTPLARMKFGLEMAERGQGVDQIKHQLRGIREDVNEMDSLVNELLAYAGFEQDDQRLEFQSGDMVYLIQQLIRRVRDTRVDLTVDIQFRDLMPGRAVVCEWHLMERAIGNVLQNALRFAVRRIDISLAEHNGHYLLTVDDDGVGVPEQERSRIFQSFVRLPDAGNAEVRGFGLGLAIVQRIVKWHRGNVRVEDSPLGGARFIIAWPVGLNHS